MTLVYYQAIVEIRDGRTRQISERERATISRDIELLFGEKAYNPQTFQDCLDSYCRRKGKYPLIITDILL